MKRWVIGRPDEAEVSHILGKTDLPKICAEIMAARGITTIEELDGFFNGGELASPFEILDMDKAAEKISSAVDSGELICIYGDYDCDGITATAILYSYLECLGANVMYYIPEREAGYGLNKEAVDVLHDSGVSLIVTVDNGISAYDEAEYIYESGMKLVVTDHHQPPEKLPRAEAVVDPHRKDCPSAYKNISGAGVALKLCAALDDGNYETVLEQFSDLAAIGTIADVVPLDGENRLIVEHGLRLLKNTENYGLNYIMEKASLSAEKLTSTNVAFGIAPRINSAGRMGSPTTAAKALLEEGEDAEIYADMLSEYNIKRKSVENEILNNIDQYILEHPEELYNRVMILCGRGWHHGVIGIVAARLVDAYGKPCFVISIDENGEARGSARSISGFHIHKCLTSCSDLLIKFGGHECAGGLSLTEENIPEFCRRVQEYAAQSCKVMPQITLTADKVLRGSDMTIKNIGALEMMEPFGEGNPRPIFAVLGAKILRAAGISEGKFTKIEVEYDGVRFPVLIFSTPFDRFPYRVGDVLNMLVTLEINVFRGEKSVSVKAVDYRLSGAKQEAYFAAKACYESFKLGEELPRSFVAKIVPTREELVDLYKYISASEKTDCDVLFMKLGEKFNYCKLRLCIDILCELDILGFDCVSSQVWAVRNSKKRQLDESGLFVKLCSMAE